MKNEVLLGCALGLIACGSSSGNANDLQPSAAPTIAAQAPQAPAESMPPANTQMPRYDTQAPPANSQPPLPNPQQPNQIAATSCDAVAAAVQSNGCAVSDVQLAQCLNYVTLGLNSACSPQLGDLLACLLQDVACANGTLNVENDCPTESTDYVNCLNGAAQNTTCSTNTSCAECASGSCEECRCRQELYPDLGVDCSTQCN